MNYWSLLEHVSSWIRFSDSKAGAVIAIGGGSLAFVFSRMLDVRSVLLERDFDLWSLLLYASFGFYVILLVYAVWKAFSSMFPRLNKVGARSIIFYKHIAEDHQSETAYVAHVRESPGTALEDEVLKQVFALSTVANEKYKLVSDAIRALGLAAILWAVFVVLIFLILPTAEQ